jgi:hypothetical protein
MNYRKTPQQNQEGTFRKMLIIREFRFTSRKGHKGLGRREHDSKEHDSKGLR